LSIAWLGVTAAGSLPGMIPEVLHGPRCSIGCPGPGVPLGGGTPGSTFGWSMANADGQVHIMAAKAAMAQAHPVWGPDLLID
jgi:hypothetical protein